jgi:hypothetical protein
VLTTVKALQQIRAAYDSDNRDLFNLVLNATSVVEANIALDLLQQHVPARALVATINMREVLKSLPPSPFTMAVDEETLVRVASMTKELAVLKKFSIDGYEIVVTTAGNLVLDLIIKRGEDKYFWTPVPVTSDFVNPALLPHLIQSDDLLDEVIELVQAMGIVFNPTLYLSLDDWHLEYAQETMEGLGDLF